MVLLENEVFLTELTKLFQKARLSGSITMTFKRYNGINKPSPREGRPRLSEPTEHMCIIRAKSRTKKISTVVHQKEINRFQLAYSSLLKGNLDGLKKIKKTKVKSSAKAE